MSPSLILTSPCFYLESADSLLTIATGLEPIKVALAYLSRPPFSYIYGIEVINGLKAEFLEA